MRVLLQVCSDTRLHRVEGPGGVGHFGRALLVEHHWMGIGVEAFHGVGEAGEGTDRDAHRQPGTGDQQRQLPEQYPRQPRRQGRHGRTHIDGQRAAVAEAQMPLKVFFLLVEPGEGQRVGITDRGADRGPGYRHLARVQRLPRFTLAQQIIVIGSSQPGEPGGTFLCGQAVENRNRRRDVVLQIVEHGAAGALVALVILRAKRQALGEDQPDQKDQRQPRSQGAWPMQLEAHAEAPRISTGSENT
jgi:hypothetical protein